MRQAQGATTKSVGSPRVVVHDLVKGSTATNLLGFIRETKRQKRIRKGEATARDVAMLIHQYASFFATTYYYYWQREENQSGSR